VPEPSTDLLYLADMPSAYLRTFEARVVKQGADYVVLDRTLFYPTGGGQEHDTGTLEWDGNRARVVRVEKKGIVKHVLDGPPPAEGATVRGEVDWERRHAHMRMHTSQHLISGLVYDLFGGVRTVGNQIHADRSRIDFRPARFSDEDLRRIEEETNRVLGAGAAVRIVHEDRAALEKRVKPDRANLDLIPPAVQRLRVIEIDGHDACPCGGTHVQSLAEIGRVRILGKSSKGSETVRIEYELDAPTPR
jgi:misacylated tRNA(Ala) deacylase